jgi:cytochrome c biogenesis protein CcdA
MNKLFDLRFVIGIFFTVIGILLLIYGFISTTESSQTINRWCGGIFTIFGIVMILISRKELPGD